VEVLTDIVHILSHDWDFFQKVQRHKINPLFLKSFRSCPFPFLCSSKPEVYLDMGGLNADLFSLGHHVFQILVYDFEMWMGLGQGDRKRADAGTDIANSADFIPRIFWAD